MICEKLKQRFCKTLPNAYLSRVEEEEKKMLFSHLSCQWVTTWAKERTINTAQLTYPKGTPLLPDMYVSSSPSNLKVKYSELDACNRKLNPIPYHRLRLTSDYNVSTSLKELLITLQWVRLMGSCHTRNQNRSKNYNYMFNTTKIKWNYLYCNLIALIKPLNNYMVN